MKSLNTIPYRPEIDGLRAIAVLSVLLFHLNLGLRGGFSGVDVFFVISGYLITDIIQNEYVRTGTFDYSRFYVRRIRRLLPALFATLAATWVFAFLLLSLPHFRYFNLSLISAALSVSNFYFLDQSGYFDEIAAFKPLLHTWSLGVEIQFYLLWPLLIVLLLKFTNATRTLLAIVLLSCLTLLADTLILQTNLLPTYRFDIKALAFYFTPLRAFEFGIGAAIVWLIRYQPKSRWISEGLFLSGLGLIAIAAYRFSERTVFPGYHALVPCLGAALVIHSVNAGRSKRILAFGPLRNIGKISYSLYLCHWPVFVFYRYYTERYLDLPLTSHDKYAVLALSFGLAILMYRYVETPFRMPRNRMAKSSAKGLLPFLLAAGLLVALGMVSLHAQGWPSRTYITAEMQQRYGRTLDNFFKQQYGGKKCLDDNNGNMGNCFRNIGAKPHIWILGDSHALHLEAGLMHWFPHKSYSIIRNNCRFQSLTTCALPWGRQYDVEIAKKPAIWEEVKKTSDTVIIAHFWPQVGNWAYKNDQGVALYSLDKNLPGFVARQVEEFKKIKAYLSNNHLIVIGALPYYATANPVDCLTYPRYFARAQRDCAKIPIKPRHVNTIEFNTMLGKALRNTGITFINPTSYLCDTQYCTVIKDGKILVSDNHHLSIDGSIYFVGKAFRNILP